jgi:small subunit ribosomal protein S6
MKKYEAVIILNPNLSSKVDEFKKDFEKLLSDNSFSIAKTEDVGRRQLAYSINNHNKGHYILFNLEGDPSKLIELETKIKYNESIIRHLFIVVKEHQGEDSSLFTESKNKKSEPVDIEVEKERKADKPKEDQQIKEPKESSPEKVDEDGED